MLLIIRAHIFKFKAFRQVVVNLDSTQLPTTTDSVFHHKVELRTIESSFSILNLSRQALLRTSLDNSLFRFFPVIIATNILFTVHFITQRYLCFKILEIHRTEHNRYNIHHTKELIFHLLRTTEDMRIILRKATNTS